jgi:hypothetical protein
MEIAEVYLDYCDCQPLPLFHRASFLTSLRQRDPEVVYAVIALAIRFYDNGSLDDPDTYNAMSDNITRYTEAARALVIKRVLEGPVELSTLQCLCILCMIDFSSMFITLVFSACMIINTYLLRRQYSACNYLQQYSYEFG